VLWLHSHLSFFHLIATVGHLLPLSSNPARNHCAVILGKAPFSKIASRNPGAVNRYGQIKCWGNPAMH